MNNTDTTNNILAETLLEQKLTEFLKENRERVVVIGIDGPTASGKTILADNIADKLKQLDYRVWNYRLDWTLRDRTDRVSDLTNLKQKQTTFDLEAELHMRLNEPFKFLQQVKEFNEDLLKNDSSSLEIKLEGLYSRENNGTCTGTDSCLLEPGLVIIMEGHYSLRSELDQFIDKNIILLADSQELINRKVERVKGYRSPDEAIDYYWRVDLPSIKHHVKRYSTSADIIVDNTDYNNPKITDHQFIDTWYSENNSKYEKADAGYDNLDSVIEKIFDDSILVTSEIKSVLKLVIQSIQECDYHFGKYFRLSIDDIDADLIHLVRNVLKELNQKLPTGFNVKLKYSNAFHNVYHRKLPISFGIQISNELFEMSIISDTNVNTQSFQFFWEGGYKKLEYKRELGAIDHKDNAALYSFIDNDENITDSLIYTPSNFTTPEFINELDSHSKVFTGLEDTNIAASEIVWRISSMKECVWIHRFPKNETIRYFESIMPQVGCDSIKVGNYLICLKSSSIELINSFKEYKKPWIPTLKEQKASKQDENAYDSLLDKDRLFIYEFVEKNCPDFKVLDSFLYSSVTFLDEKWESIVEQIGLMLKSKNRLLRKRTFQFIKLRFPDLSVSTQSIWPDLAGDKEQTITIDELNKTYPTLMAEIFMWMTLRNEKSAVLGANIYDIRNGSLDSEAHLKKASEFNCPVILQSSLNAIGQREEDSWGYLKVDDSVNTFSNSVLNESRKMTMDGSTPPLYGIGLDHINVSGNKPEGRAARFAQKAMESELITYYVLDGESLFKPKDRSPNEIAKSFKNMSDYTVTLLHDNEQAYIFDKEVCIGELNYIGRQAWIPYAEEVESFADVYRQVARENNQAACNTRPLLFIGNLGTTHHSSDHDEIKVELSHDWVEAAKKYNFISAVLHGTTNTKREKLTPANVGCKKINIAGDFLHIIVDTLPKNLKEMINDPDQEVKRLIHSIREQMDSLSANDAKAISDKVGDYSQQLMKDINSPNLTKNDIDYFRYSFYRFSDLEINSIQKELIKKKNDQLNTKVSELIVPEIERHMSSSMIEVPYDDKFEGLVKFLIEDNGIKYFHIDVGDGQFINREFSGLEKTQFIKKHYPHIQAHAHFMVESPHHKTSNGKSYIQNYAEAGCDKIAIHRRAFESVEEMEIAISQIRECKSEPGFIIETSDSIDIQLLDQLVKYNINWVVVMGVPVGFGGQMFNTNTLLKISSLYHWSLTNNHKLLLEADGGLTFENIKLCRDVGIQIFAGWSVIKDSTYEGISNNLTKINQILKDA